MIIDTHVHIRAFSAKQAQLTGNRPFDESLDFLIRTLSSKPISSIYDFSMDLLNFQDNQLANGVRALRFQVLKKGLTYLHLPFYAERGEKKLIESMIRSGISQSLILALEPYSMSDEVISICQRHPGLFPVVHIPVGTERVEERAKSLHLKGAIGLRIHPYVDGISPEHPFYFRLAEVAQKFNWPIVCRTGGNAFPNLRGASICEIERYDSLVSSFPKVSFLMAHSNFGDHQAAIRFAQKNPNVYLDTSWQTLRTIHDFVNFVGSERIVFASDWPIFGDQQRTQSRILNRLRLSTSEKENIACKNAMKLFRISNGVLDRTAVRKKSEATRNKSDRIEVNH